MSMNDSVLLTLAGSKPVQLKNICKKTGLSAPALADCIRVLRAAGANIEQIDDSLYWPDSFDCLDPAVIAAALECEKNLITVLDSTTSTNTILAAEKSVHSKVVLAEHQSAGVGRRGKPWLSPLGKNLYISCGWSMPSALLFGGLSLAIGVAVARALRDIGYDAVGLKWPNDFYVNGSKLGGLLIESSSRGADAQLIIGLGLNAHAQDFPEDLPVPATTLADTNPSLETSCDRNYLAARLVGAIFQELDAIVSGETSALRCWPAYDVSYNREVSVLKNGEVITGVAKGISADGEFILSTEDGFVSFSQADVSLRI